MEALRTLLDRYLASGDEGAIDELVARTRPRLLKAARKIGAPQDAEDAVQGAYLALTRKGAALDAPVFPWLLTAVVRIAYRRKALERRQRDLARRLAEPRDAASPATAAIDAETGARVREDVARLPAKYRDVVVLHYLEGLSTPEIARLLAMPDATVRTRLARGRALLKGPLAPLWTAMLLALPWLAADLGGHAVRKKSLALALPLLLVAVTGGVWLASTRTGPERTGSRASGAPLAVAAAEPAPAAADARPPAGPALRGVVQDRAGRPVTGACVRVDDDRAARSDEAGRFVAPVSGEKPHYRVLVEAAGFSPALRAHAVPGSDLVVTLEEAPVLTGTVRDLGSRPVAGARVTWRIFLDGVPYERTSVTDTEGRYRVADLPSPFAFPALSAYMAALRVDARGFAPLRVRAPLPGARGPAELAKDLFLSAGAILRGRVLADETGAGLPGARVELRTLQGGDGHAVLASAVADGEGRFVMERVPASGYHDVVALNSGSNRWLGWLHAELEDRFAVCVDVGVLADGRAYEYEVRCYPRATVRGRVAGAGAGVRVSAAAVGVPPRSIYGRTGLNAWVETDAEGRYEAVVVPGRVYLTCGKAICDVVARAGATVEAPELVPPPVAPFAVVAEVVDEEGAPVWGAKVEAGRVWAETGRDGRARIELATAEPVAVRAWSHVSGSRTAAPVAPSAERPPVVRVVLDATRAIEGEVFWADGAPAAGVQLTVQDGPRLAGHAQAGRDGAFRAARLVDGAYTVTARAWDYKGETVEASAEARAGATGVRLVLPRLPEAETVALEGTLRAHGKPLLDFACTLSDGTRSVHAERAGPGRFRFPRAPLGTWTLRVTASGFAPKAVRGIVLRRGAPPPPLAIDLEGGVTVRGRIRGGEEGQVVNLFLVTADGLVSRAPHERAGTRYRIDDVRPGRHRPFVYPTKGWVAKPAALVVPEDAAEVEFDVELVPGATVRFGLEAVRAGVVVRDAQGETVYERTDPAHGAAAIGLPAGEYLLLVGDEKRPLTVEAGTDLEILR